MLRIVNLRRDVQEAGSAVPGKGHRPVWQISDTVNGIQETGAVNETADLLMMPAVDWLRPRFFRQSSWASSAAT